MIELHLVSWNRPQMTELVIRTIHRNTNRDDFRLVVLDNGSEKSTQQLLDDLGDNGYIDELFLFDDNLGLEASRQFMFEATDTDMFVDIDNDCLPPKDWLPRQLELMQKYEDYAAIAQRTQVMIGTGNIFETADDLNLDIVEFPHPGGSFRMMRTHAVQEVGGWDKKTPGRGAEERYICGKLNEAGYKTAFAPQIKSLHLFGLRGANGTDRWGYNQGLSPEHSGHSDIWHPALINGDDLIEIEKYSGKELCDAYSSNPSRQ